MLELKKLILSGIGRIVEEQTIDFTQLGTLVQVDGQNTNTGGSSGAGKTTLFNALDYLLGLNDIPNSILQSRLTEETIKVTGIFQLDGKTITIQRGKKLSIDIDGEVTVGSNKLAEEKLDQLLGMPRERFRQILHKRQGEGGFFLKMTPKETHEFLMDCLGHSHLKPKLDALDKSVSELTKEVNALKSKVEAGHASLRATQNAIKALGSAPVQEVHQEVILSLKDKMEGSGRTLEGLKATHRLELETLELTRPQVSVTPFDTTKKESLEKHLNEVRQAAQHLVQAERDRQAEVGKVIADLRVKRMGYEGDIEKGAKASLEAVQIAGEIKKIRDSICPTCEQNWATEKAKAKEAELLNKLTFLKEAVANGNGAKIIVAELTAKINSLNEDLMPKPIHGLQHLSEREAELTASIQFENQAYRDHQAIENTKNRALLDKFAAAQRELQTKHSLELQQASGQYDLDRRAFEASVQKLKAFQDSKNRYEQSLQALKAQEKNAEDYVMADSFLLLAKEDRLQLAEEVKRAVKSYTSCSFDDALDEIGDTATRIIRGIPNMANATIQLQGVRETKEGKVKEEVNAVINVDGEVGVPFKSLSGGERSSVDLAIDLAVIELLENKSNKGIDVFILDEPFTGLDTVSIEMALDVLKNSNLSKRLVIVDHNPEVKQMVQSRLVVVREGTTSRVMQQ